MRCVGKEYSLGNVPKQQHSLQGPRWRPVGYRSHWAGLECRKCGGPVWVTKKNIDKYGTDWSCADCRKYDKLLARDAMIAVYRRKKEMGLR